MNAVIVENRFNMKKLTIAIDFDGTIVTHEFPEIGKDIGAIPVIKELQEAGHKIILYTMRGKKGRDTLGEAVGWLENQGVTLTDVNRNRSQWFWTDSPKVHANLYIDDAALGAPLKYDPSLSERPFIDWKKVREELTNRGIL